MSRKVAIIEDDFDQARLLASWLTNYGYQSTLFLSAELFLDSKNSDFDLLLVDWVLPGLSGLELVKQLSEANIRTPKIFITGKKHDDDLAMALHNGADDFVSKPVSRTVLIARIHAVMRSHGLVDTNSNNRLTHALELDNNTKHLKFAGQELRLTPSEFQLLQVLVQAQERVLSREELADCLWQDETKANEGRALDLLISRLRKKISELNPSPGQLVNRYGHGYAFERE